MIKKISVLFCTFSFLFSINAYANEDKLELSVGGFYGIINTHLIPKTSATIKTSGDITTTITDGNTIEDIFGGSSLGIEILGGFEVKSLLIELSLGYINHTNILEEDVTYTASSKVVNYASTTKVANIDTKIALLYSTKIETPNFILYPYVGPQIGFTITRINIKEEEYDKYYDETTESTYSASTSGLLYGLKGGIRLPITESIFGDLGLSYTRRNVASMQYEDSSISLRLNSFSANLGVGMNF